MSAVRVKKRGRTGFGSRAGVCAFLLPLFLTPQPCSGGTGGFFLGAGFHSSHIAANDPAKDSPVGSVFVEETGGGLALLIGRGITSAFSVRLVLSGAEHETTNPRVEFFYSGATIEGAYLFRDGEPLRPYLFGGLGAFAIESRHEALRFKTTGPGAAFGAGIVYFLGRHFALDFAIRGELINWEKKSAEGLLNGLTLSAETPVEEEGSAVKLLFGGSWWF